MLTRSWRACQEFLLNRNVLTGKEFLVCRGCGLQQEVDAYKLYEYGWQKCAACEWYVHDRREWL